MIVSGPELSSVYLDNKDECFVARVRFLITSVFFECPQPFEVLVRAKRRKAIPYHRLEKQMVNEAVAIMKVVTGGGDSDDINLFVDPILEDGFPESRRKVG